MNETRNRQDDIMDVNKFIEEFFIDPIVEHSGYNIVNTFVYAVIAIVAAFLIYKWLKPKFTQRFILYLIPFVLFGSTVRVLSDTIDTGVAQQYTGSLGGLIGVVINLGIYNYSIFTATPGIYIITAMITLIALILSEKLRRPKLFPLIGLALWIPHFIILIPMFKEWMFFVMIALIVVVSLAVTWPFLSHYKLLKRESFLAILGHALDGSASFVAIEIFNRMSTECTDLGHCYFGQHVVERTLSNFIPFGTAMFLLLKIIFAIFAVFFIERYCKDQHEKMFFYTLIIIFGLAPGIRNTLRILAGA